MTTKVLSEHDSITTNHRSLLRLKRLYVIHAGDNASNESDMSVRLGPGTVIRDKWEVIRSLRRHMHDNAMHAF